MEPASATPRRFRTAVVALAAAAALVAAPLSAAADHAGAGNVVLHVEEPGVFELTLIDRGDDVVWFQRYEATVENLSGDTQTFGFGATAWQPDVVEQLWDHPILGGLAQVSVAAGAQPEVAYVPDWPGVDFTFFRDIQGTAEVVATFDVSDQHVPVRFDELAGGAISWQIGRTLTTPLAPAHPGEFIVVSASDVDAAATGVYLVPESSFVEQVGNLHELSLDAAGNTFARFLGTVPVTNGDASGLVTIPADTAPGRYAVLLDGGSAPLWQAGPPLVFESGGEVTASNLLIEAGTAGDTVVGDDVVVVPQDPETGESIFTFGFDQVTEAGVTTVRSTNTLPGGVPAPISFSVGDPPLYFLLDTSAGFEGQIQLCARVAGLPEAEFNAVGLYHFTGTVWEQIGQTWTYDETTGIGTICGSTTTLSPFALGTSTFEGFLQPVDNGGVYNAMKAGSAVPVKFRVGGDHGLDILASGSPASAKVTCDSGTPVDAVEQISDAGSSGLQYDATTATYSYVWKTVKSWAGTCRQFVLTLDDGSTHTAYFRFR